MKIAANRILILLVCFIFILPVASWAHASLDHSNPKVGATISSSPSLIRIWFDCELEPALSKLIVRNGDNRAVDKNDSRVDTANPKLLEVSVPKLPPGRYRVFWNVASKDGHHTNGDFTFKIKQKR